MWLGRLEQEEEVQEGARRSCVCLSVRVEGGESVNEGSDVPRQVRRVEVFGPPCDVFGLVCRSPLLPCCFVCHHHM